MNYKVGITMLANKTNIYFKNTLKKLYLKLLVRLQSKTLSEQEMQASTLPGTNSQTSFSYSFLICAVRLLLSLGEKEQIKL